MSTLHLEHMYVILLLLRLAYKSHVSVQKYVVAMEHQTKSIRARQPMTNVCNKRHVQNRLCKKRVPNVYEIYFQSLNYIQPRVFKYNMNDN